MWELSPYPKVVLMAVGATQPTHLYSVVSHSPPCNSGELPGAGYAGCTGPGSSGLCETAD